MLLLCAAPVAGRQTADVCESCIERMACGDKDALATLFATAKDAVYGFALSITRNAEDAEDVLQDTFVSAYASAAGYKDMGKPMAWLLTIAKNLALSKARASSRSANLTDDEWGLLPAGDTGIAIEDRIALQTALTLLPPTESQIVMLHAVAGFKHREIAALLDLPLSTTLSKYSRSIKKLKSSIEEAIAHA